MDQPLINRIVEAALLAANQPLTLAQLHGLFPEEQPAPPGSVEQALETLRESCAERGVELVEVASGFRYQVKADVHEWVARLWTERKTKYTRATLETLALIAYRQPITRGEIEQVRGVAVSSNIIQALEEREWIRVVGHRDVPGKPALFGTTKQFLDYFGLKSLDQLPPLAELKDIGELEPQLPFEGAPVPAGIAQAAGNPADDGANADAGTGESGENPPEREQAAETGETEATGEASDAAADNDQHNGPDATDPPAVPEAQTAAAGSDHTDTEAAAETAAPHHDNQDDDAPASAQERTVSSEQAE